MLYYMLYYLIYLSSCLLQRLTLGALGLKLNDYWKEMTEKKAREREFQALDRDEDEDKHDADELV